MDLLQSFLSVGADNKAKSAEDRYKYVSVQGMTFLKAKLLPSTDDTPDGVVRVDLSLNGTELVYYTNNFAPEYFEKFERGVLVDLTAKRWFDHEGKPEYEGRTTAWTIDAISVAAIKAGSPIVI